MDTKRRRVGLTHLSGFARAERAFRRLREKKTTSGSFESDAASCAEEGREYCRQRVDDDEVRGKLRALVSQRKGKGNRRSQVGEGRGFISRWRQN
jgi:hypothetical protein